MAIIGSFATVRAQAPSSAGLTAAFAYVAELLRPESPARTRLRGMAAGTTQRVELGDGVVAIDQVLATKARADAFFESHRKFIDVQVVIEGAEAMEVVDAAHITVQGEFQEDRDLQLYQDTPRASVARLGPGDAAIFFPVDVHMPLLQSGSEPGTVRKTVVKVPVS